MRVIGFDPGLRNLGWGVISRIASGVEYIDSGVITTPAKTPYGASLHQLRREAMCVMEYWEIDEIGIEDVHAGVKHVSSIKGTNYVIGMLHELAAYKGYPEPHLITPPLVKKTLTGDGRADKGAVLEAVVESLRLTSVVFKGIAPKGVVKAGHASDALAIALTAEKVRVKKSC